MDITYEKRKAIKSQVLLDFTVEWLELQSTGPPDLSSVWTMYFDGSKRVQGAGAGVVLISPHGDKLKYVLRMSFLQASNNEAEYEALLHGMNMAKACGATRLKIFGDSNLVVQEVMNRCDTIHDNMMAYKNLYHYLEGTFNGCEVSHISRNNNEEANNLANIGSQCLPLPPGVFWEEIVEISKKKRQNFDYCSRLGGCARNRRSHDDRRNLDAAISRIHDKQAVTRRCRGSQENNSMIKSICHVAGEIIQKEHNWCFAALRNTSRRASNTKRYTRRSMWPSC
jgi:ribonuclease HI